jgi:peroxin-14
LNTQFDAAELLLKEIQAESAAVRVAVDEQRVAIEKTTKDVQTVVVEMRDGEQKTRDEIREIRDEVNNIRDLLPKVLGRLPFISICLTTFQMIEKNKESHNQSLAELQQELKSLKALLLNRGTSIPSTPSSPLPTVGRPVIPSWQLASTALNGAESSSSEPKGKEVAEA